MALLSIKLEKINFLLAWLTLLLIYCRDQTKPSGESATGGAATHLCLRTEIFRPTLAIHSHLLSPCEENSIIWKRDWPLTWNICFRVVFLIQTSGFSGGDDGRTFSQVLSHIRGHDHPTLISTYIHKRCSSYLLMSKQSYISEKCQHWSWHQSQDDHSGETQADEGLQEAPGDYYFQWSTFGCCEQNNSYQFKHNCCSISCSNRRTLRLGCLELQGRTTLCCGTLWSSVPTRPPLRMALSSWPSSSARSTLTSLRWSSSSPRWSRISITLP